MQKTIVDLIRHGEPEGGSRYRGHTIDDPLSELGWSQMWNAVEPFSSWQQIVSSPLSRCSDFARELSEKLQIEMSVEDDLKEIGFGDWEGKTRAQLKQENLQQYQDFYRDPELHRPPGAEALGLFVTRVADVYDKILNQHSGRHCLLVTHAGVIRAVVAHLLQIPPGVMYNITIKNAGITRIQIVNNRQSLECINQTMHGIADV